VGVESEGWAKGATYLAGPKGGHRVPNSDERAILYVEDEADDIFPS
jgi:hypothetical protein